MIPRAVEKRALMEMRMRRAHIYRAHIYMQNYCTTTSAMAVTEEDIHSSASVSTIEAQDGLAMYNNIQH